MAILRLFRLILLGVRVVEGFGFRAAAGGSRALGNSFAVL